jgi:hypothetical protein
LERKLIIFCPDQFRRHANLRGPARPQVHADRLPEGGAGGEQDLSALRPKVHQEGTLQAVQHTLPASGKHF